MNLKKKLNDGFTLIQIMILVVIIGILATFAIQAYKNYAKATAQLTEVTKDSSTILKAAKKTKNKCVTDRTKLANTVAQTVLNRYNSITGINCDQNTVVLTTNPDNIVYVCTNGACKKTKKAQ